MRIVFMGTPDFSVPTLEAILQAGHDVVAVVTQPDKAKGRSGALSMSPVKEAALRAHLTVLQPVKASDPEFVTGIRDLKPDCIVVVAFGQLLPESLLQIPAYGCVNVHASLLPKYRGASPIQWAVIDGCTYSGVTTMLMAKGLDTGDLLLSEKVRLAPKETGGSLFTRLSSVGAELLVRTLQGLEEHSITPVQQNEQEATYVKMLKKSFGDLDFSQEAEHLECLIRGLNPWPSAFTHYHGKLLKIWDADVEKLPANEKTAVPGTILAVEKDSFLVRCGKDGLRVREVQMEGKKRMTAAVFLLGNPMRAGETLER